MFSLFIFCKYFPTIIWVNLFQQLIQATQSNLDQQQQLSLLHQHVEVFQ